MKKSNIILVSLIVFFILLTILVVNNLTYTIDSNVYKFLINYKNDSLTNFFKFITKFTNVKIAFIIVIVSAIFFRKKGILVIITGIDIYILNTILKLIIKRDRPSILQLVKVNNYSYPSGHAMISMGVYGCLIYMILKTVKNKKLKSFLVSILSLLILIIGISRIYLGVHYFTDIVAGFTLSIIYLIILDKVVSKWGIFDV